MLTSNAITYRRDKSVPYARSSLIILIIALLININSFFIEFFETTLGLFGGLFHSNAISHLFHMFLFLITGLIIQLNAFYPRKIWTNQIGTLFHLCFSKLIHINNLVLNKMKEQFIMIEYPLIILFVTMGGTLLLTSSDVISIYLSIELQSYGLYILCAMYRNSERSTGGALIYFLLGGLSSCFILLAFGLGYCNLGNTSMDGIYMVNFLSNLGNNIDMLYKYVYAFDSHYMQFSLVVLSIGLLFKISAAPFHFWSPDVYDGIPTIVTTFVAIFAKISIFILLLELVHYTSNNIFYNESIDSVSSVSNNGFTWTYTLLISSFMSLVIGSVLGLTQVRIKRLYAYSTISHVGFILLALTINTIESIQSFIFYLVQYSLSNLNAFILLIYMGYSLYFYTEKLLLDQKDKKFIENISRTNSVTTYNESSLLEPDKVDNKQQASNTLSSSNLSSTISDKNNSPIQVIDQIKGYFFVNPMIALSFSITIFSFVGIPPLIGFFAKQMVLNSAIYNGYIFMSIVAILASTVSAYYYLVLVKQVFFYHIDYDTHIEPVELKAQLTNYSNDNITDFRYTLNNVYLTGSLSTSISILTLIILLFMFVPQEWLNLANILAMILFNN